MEFKTFKNNELRSIDLISFAPILKEIQKIASPPDLGQPGCILITESESKTKVLTGYPPHVKSKIGNLHILKRGDSIELKTEKDQTVYAGVTIFGKLKCQDEKLDPRWFDVNLYPLTQDKNEGPELPIETQAKTWLAKGETGSSSKALCYWLTTKRVKKLIESIDEHCRDDLKNYPHDPSDFKRCIDFLEAVPGAKDQFEKMKKVSGEWASLVKNWPNLTRLYERDKGKASSKELYDEIQKILLSEKINRLTIKEAKTSAKP